MGRRPIGKKAMTATERQQKRRKRLKREKLKALTKADRLAKRAKSAMTTIPSPPGITYWHWITVTTPEGEPRKIMQPTTKPLAAIKSDELDDADIRSLLRLLTLEARRRKMDAATVVAEAMAEHPYATLLMSAKVATPDDDTTVIIGP